MAWPIASRPAGLRVASRTRPVKVGICWPAAAGLNESSAMRTPRMSPNGGIAACCIVEPSFAKLSFMLTKAGHSNGLAATASDCAVKNVRSLLDRQREADIERGAGVLAKTRQFHLQAREGLGDVIGERHVDALFLMMQVKTGVAEAERRHACGDAAGFRLAAGRQRGHGLTGLGGLGLQERGEQRILARRHQRQKADDVDLADGVILVTLVLGEIGEAAIVLEVLFRAI